MIGDTIGSVPSDYRIPAFHVFFDSSHPRFSERGTRSASIPRIQNKRVARRDKANSLLLRRRSGVQGKSFMTPDC